LRTHELTVRAFVCAWIRIWRLSSAGFDKFSSGGGSQLGATSIPTFRKAPSPSSDAGSLAGSGGGSGWKSASAFSAFSADGSDVGSDLFGDLPAEERMVELDQLMATVQNQIDLESETRTEFERQLEESDDIEARDRFEANIALSDERMSLLASRMLKAMSAVRTIDA
jgi:hypothetical protein